MPRPRWPRHRLVIPGQTRNDGERVSMAKLTDSTTNKAAETPLEPNLPICDPHHHLWRRPNNPYLLDDFLREASGRHRIVSSVAVECGAMYRETGLPELRPVGETEFLEGIAVENSRAENTTAVAAAIVAYADLTLGDGVAAVLEAHLEASPTRLRGIRYSTMWDASDSFRSVPRPGLLRDAAVRKGFACLQRHGLSFDAWLYHPQIPELVELGAGFPRRAHHPRSHRRAPGAGTLRGPPRRSIPGLERRHHRPVLVPQRRAQAGRRRISPLGLRLAPAYAQARLRRAGRGHAAVLRILHRAVRRRPLHVRKQFPGGPGILYLCIHLERLQDHGPGATPTRNVTRCFTTRLYGCTGWWRNGVLRMASFDFALPFDKLRTR